MTPTADHRLVLFPGALGDLLCCWPALDTLGADGAAITLAARRDATTPLPLHALTVWSIDRREITELFGAAPLSPGARTLFASFTRVDSFTGYGDAAFAARLTLATGQPAAVHPFRGAEPGEHARTYFGRCLGVQVRLRHLPVHEEAAAWAAALWRRDDLGEQTLVVHAGSGAPAKNWDGMQDAADRWRRAGGRVVSVSGPAEIERGTGLSADCALRNEPLSRVAAVIARARYYLGNDSGISHLAGLVGARAVVVFGGSDPATWAPAGAGVRVLRAAGTCSRCGRGRLCIHRLPVASVMAALD